METKKVHGEEEGSHGEEEMADMDEMEDEKRR